MTEIEEIAQFLYKQGRLSEEKFEEIIIKSTKIFEKEDNLLELQDPINIVGDIHGQYYDLLKMFSVGGNPKENQYLFLGDYVDRGMFGVEVIQILLLYKIEYPSSFYMLRGNHECRHLTNYFNFKKECIFKYNERIYDLIMKLFDSLPISAILNSKFLCVHGGISPDIINVQDINNINRFQEIPSSGPFCDLLWSDPYDGSDQEDDFVFNQVRNCSFIYNFNAVNQFLEHNNLLCVFRSHEVQDEGFKLFKKNDNTNFPTVICVFSAPNYCDSYGNTASIIRFNNNSMNIRQFKHVEHPFVLPNHINVFDWSLPFIFDKVLEIIYSIYSISEEIDDNLEDQVSLDKANIIRMKLLSLGRMSKMINTLNDEKDTIEKLKLVNNGIIPQGLLIKGIDALKIALKDFNEVKKLDSINEQRPDSPGTKIEKKSMSFKGKFKFEKNFDLKSVDSPTIVIGEKKVE